MSAAPASAELRALQRALADGDPALGPGALLERLVEAGLDRLPAPAGGATLERWRMLAAVARHDLSLAKLFEGHTDALAILEELGHPVGSKRRVWGVWAAESPQGRARLAEPPKAPRPTLAGAKFWCSGAATATHGLLTAWIDGEPLPQLVSVEIAQPGVHVDSGAWQAVGMAGSASLDVRFDAAIAEPVGKPGQYLSRPGFWQGGAGVAACWFGGAQAVADALYRAVQAAGADARNTDFRKAACGKVDLELRSTAALLREVAGWIDSHPQADAQAQALRARLAAERCARMVLDEVGRTLGATPFCRDAGFARVAADLPVFVRQSHAERDFAALGQAWPTEGPDTWAL